MKSFTITLIRIFSLNFSDCPIQIQELIPQCWNELDSKRPSMLEVFNVMQELSKLYLYVMAINHTEIEYIQKGVNE